MIGRSLGWIFLFAAGAILVRDALVWHDMGTLKPETFEDLWFDVSSTSFGLFRGAMLSTMPWLWNDFVGPFFTLWAGPVLLALGLILLWRARFIASKRH